MQDTRADVISLLTLGVHYGTFNFEFAMELQVSTILSVKGLKTSQLLTVLPPLHLGPYNVSARKVINDGFS